MSVKRQLNSEDKTGGGGEGALDVLKFQNAVIDRTMDMLLFEAL